MARLSLGRLVERVVERVPAGVGGRPFVGLEHIVPHQLRLAGTGDASATLSEGVAFRAGDVLYGGLRPGFNKAVIAPFDGIGSAELMVLRCRPGVSAGLVLAWLAHPDTTTQAMRLGRGTRMPRVAWSDLARLERDLPDPRGRDQLGGWILHLQERLDLLHHRARTASQILSAAVRRAATPGRGPFLGEVAPPRLAAPTPAQDVPSGAPVLGLADLPRDALDVHTWDRSPGRSAKRAVCRGDVLVSRLRPELHKAALCPVDGFCSTEIIALVPDEGLTAVIAGRVRDAAVQARWTRTATGTRMPRVPRAQVLQIRLDLDLDHALDLGRALDPVLNVIIEATDRAGTLRDVRDGLIVHALDVPERAERLPVPPITG